MIMTRICEHAIWRAMLVSYYINITCGAFPEDQWISILVSFTMVVTGSPSPSQKCSNVLAQPNPMHLIVYVRATGQVTTIHCLLQMSSRMGQPNTQLDGWNFATDMDQKDMGIRTVEQPPNMFNWAPPTIVPVLAEEVLQYFVDNPQEDYMPVLLAGQAYPGTETVFVKLCTFVPHFLAPLFVAAIFHVACPAVW